MKGYTFSEARQNFAARWTTLRKEDAAQITRRDGRTFTI